MRHELGLLLPYTFNALNVHFDAVQRRGSNVAIDCVKNCTAAIAIMASMTVAFGIWQSNPLGKGSIKLYRSPRGSRAYREAARSKQPLPA
jgi:hypothetical protein